MINTNAIGYNLRERKDCQRDFDFKPSRHDVPMNLQSKDLRADDHTPEVSREQPDVQKRRRSHPQHHRHRRVKPRQKQSVTSQVPSHLGIPCCVLKGLAIEDGRLHTVDEHSPPCQLADNLVQRLLAHEKLLRHVGQTVAGRSQQGKQISLDLVLCGSAIGFIDVVRRDEETESRAADENSHVLENVISDMEEDEGDDHNHGYGPEVDELRREDIGILIGQHRKVISLDVEERQDEVFPPVDPAHSQPSFDPIFV